MSLSLVIVPMKTTPLPSVFKILISPTLVSNYSCVLLHPSAISSLWPIPFRNFSLISSIYVFHSQKCAFSKDDPKIWFLLAHLNRGVRTSVCLKYRSMIARKPMLLYEILQQVFSVQFYSLIFSYFDTVFRNSFQWDSQQFACFFPAFP